MKNFKLHFLNLIIAVIGAVIIVSFGAYILHDVAELYHLEYLSSLTKEMLIGYLSIIGVLKYTTKTKKEKEGAEDNTLKLINWFFELMIVWLSFWGLSYLYHLILF